MARGRIQNRALLQQAANVLDVEGVTRFPAILDLDNVKAVYVLGTVSSSPAEVFSLGKSYGAVPLALDGLSAWSQYISSRIADANNPFYVNDDYALDLVGLEITISYDAAGAIADNGLQLNLILARSQNYGSIDQNVILHLLPWQTVANGTLVYRFGLASFNQGSTIVPSAVITPSLSIPGYLHVPKGDRLVLTIGRVAGGVFPANTTIDIQAHAFTSGEQTQAAWTP